MYTNATQLPSTTSGPTSASTSSWTTCLKTRISPLSISFRCIYTGSVTMAYPPKTLFSGWTRLQRRGKISWRPNFWRDATTPASPQGQTHETLTSDPPACYGTLPNKTPLHSGKRIPPLASSWRPHQQPNPPVSSPCATQTLSILPCSSVCDIVFTSIHNQTGTPFSSNYGTCISTTKTALFHKMTQTITSFAPVLSLSSQHSEELCLRRVDHHLGHRPGARKYRLCRCPPFTPPPKNSADPDSLICTYYPEYYYTTR